MFTFPEVYIVDYMRVLITTLTTTASLQMSTGCYAHLSAALGHIYASPFQSPTIQPFPCPKSDAHDHSKLF